MTPLGILVDVTVILAVALAASAMMRRRAAALRHAVLTAGVVAALCTPALELLVPQFPVRPWQANAPVSAPVTRSVVATTVPSAPAPDDVPASPVFPWGALLAATWALGAGAMLAGLSASLARLGRVRRRCTPIGSGRWRDIADELLREVPRRVQLLQSDHPALLVSCGLRRPAIILPRDTGGWSDERRRVVLTHELAHVHRRDAAIQLLGEVLRVVCWFHPLVWLVCSRLRHESECACDDAVLRAGVDPADYANHLLDVARLSAGHQQGWAAAPAIAHLSTLEKRVAIMLDTRQNRRPLTLTMRAAVVMCSAALVAPIVAAGAASEPDTAAAFASRVGDVMLTPDAAASAVSAPPDVTVSRPALQSPADRSRVTARVMSPPVLSPESRPIVPAVTRPAAVAAAAAAGAQAAGTITGAVVDQTGAVLPGASVSITELGLSLQRSTTSDSNGRFRFRDLPPATYAVAASLPGFSMVTSTATLTEGESVVRALTLPIGTLEESIVVTCTVAWNAGATPRQSAGAVGGFWLARRLAAVQQAVFPSLSAQTSPNGGSPLPPVRVGGSLHAPRKTHDVRPACPPMDVTGGRTVVLFARIAADGTTRDVRSLSPAAELPIELLRSAVDAVQQWTFTPTLLNGRPVDASVTVTIHFR